MRLFKQLDTDEECWRNIFSMSISICLKGRGCGIYNLATYNGNAINPDHFEQWERYTKRNNFSFPGSNNKYGISSIVESTTEE